MTERGQLATEAQRNDMDMLVERLEDLKANEELGPFEDEHMVKCSLSTFCYCRAWCVSRGVGRRAFGWPRKSPPLKTGAA